MKNLSIMNMLTIYIVVASMCLVCGCNLHSENDHVNMDEPVVVFAKGLKKHGEWVYFDNYFDNSVYRINTDGGVAEKLLEKSSTIALFDTYLLGYDYSSKIFKKINISDGTKIEFNIDGKYFTNDTEWIYYSNNDDNNKLYRIRNDGSGMMKLSDNQAIQIAIFEDSIYYINTTDMKLYKVDRDGNNMQKLSSANCYNYRVFSEKIFYNSGERGYEFYKIDRDGSNETLIMDNTDVMLLDYMDGWIYYTNNIDFGGKPYKIREDGTENHEVTDRIMYYANSNDGNKLYRICEDGINDYKITDEWVGSFIVSGEYIYYSVSCGGVSDIVVALAKKHSGEATREDRKFINDYFAQRHNMEGSLFRLSHDGEEKIELSKTNNGYN